ncbi:MAG: hypothetical protein R3C99_13695 [Pirellulaceae bacterium]
MLDTPATFSFVLVVFFVVVIALKTPPPALLDTSAIRKRAFGVRAKGQTSASVLAA